MSQSKSFWPTEKLLAGAGPSNVAGRIALAMAKPTLGHLDPEFINLMDDIKNLLRNVFNTKNNMTYPVSAPASLAMEIALVNLMEAGDQVIVCQNGLFAGRMKEIVTRAGGKVIAVDDEWGRPISLQKVDDAIKNNPNARIISFVHAETSTGVVSDAKEICALAKKNNLLTIVDCVTSFGGMELLVDQWQFDITFSGTQKCLGGPAGMSPITFSNNAIEHIQKRKTKVQSWFMDVLSIMSYWSGDSKRTYHHTAPINMIYALHESLCMLLTNGLENSYQRHLDVHLLFAREIKKLNLEYLVEEKFRLPQLNALVVPKGIDEAKIRSRLLQEFKIEIGAGLGPLAGKIWRIGLMGVNAQPATAYRVIDALKQVLA